MHGVYKHLNIFWIGKLGNSVAQIEYMAAPMTIAIQYQIGALTYAAG